MNVREAERFLSALAGVRAAGQRAAVATVVRVHGSAYRREGARMLVRPDGSYECALSGGCLEPAVAEAAGRVMATGDPVVVTYDLADDSVWGLNIGCSGAVDIRIERIDDDDAVTTAWLHAIGHGESAVLVTPLAGAAGRRVLLASGAAVGHLSDAVLEHAADRRAADRLAARQEQSAAEQVGDAELFFEVNLPPPPLVIFGAGHDAVPLARHAWSLGFAVTVVDPRGAFLTEAFFPGARLVEAHFDRLASAVSLGDDAFVVVMNHHTERDRDALRFSLEAGPRYIGVLGPRIRYERLLADVQRDGYEPPGAALARVHSPVGLSLGAETPDEVALSILGEIVAVRQGFSGGFLSTTTSPLHRPTVTPPPPREP
ncbi:MAG TPA: XdhC family protein [Vicinamibacterales bacterium]|nr:XdhC family protein [Vicinamibacterales bacterium]